MANIKNTTTPELLEIKSICVYCGSKTGISPLYAELANDLGQFIGSTQRVLVYGGGSIGLMGIVATSTMKAGGNAIGIIPKHLDALEVSYKELDELHITDNMHDRKKMMFDRSDAFVVLPGGLGSMDEFFETLTWAQLQLHSKPIYLFNANGYWDKLISLIDNIVDEGFAHAAHKKLFTVVETLEELTAIIEKGYEEGRESQSKLI